MNDTQRRSELAQFLRTRRERLSPVQVHLPAGRGRRRTPGLRREELAQIADVSLSWYIKLEQGQDIQVSAQIVESLARALQLSAAERTHLFVLARQELPLPEAIHTQHISSDHRQLLDSFHPHPAFIVNERWDVIGRNRMAQRVFTYQMVLTPQDHNLLWLIFTRPEQRKLYIQWEAIAQHMLALFRASEGLYRDDSWFVELRDLLMQASPEFRMWWPRHDVGEVHVRRKDLCHPAVGPLILQSTTLTLTDAAHLRLFLYTPLAEADTANKLAQLADTL